ncbi:PIN domain-containing protein [Streptomyces sp. NPDC058745]|uniref:PIN domain-containing protein n=1 Tax=Streptomyces sp. NPDC058745 TaxID=3346621 RepID=UPI0036B89995
MNAENLDGRVYSSAHSRLVTYLNWANESVRVLSSQITSRDIDKLIRTRMYQSLLDGVGHLAGSSAEGLVNGLISFEVRQRVDSLSEAVDAFEAQLRRWPGTVAVAVLDTSFFIKHPDKFEDVDFNQLIVTPYSVRVVVPMVVVDELDRLKESKNQLVRWRAGYSLAVLDRLLDGGTGTSAHEVEILTDAPDHVRLPDEDDEIVDRSLAVYAVASGSVRLITYDTGMAMRAKMLGLPVEKLRTDAGTGPEPEGK